MARFHARAVPLRLECLEGRDAPATLVGGNKVTYQDVDGDNVSVTFSKPILSAGNVDSVFGAGFVNGNNNTKQQLQKIDLTGIGAAAGTTITLTATRSPTNFGDGFAALGHIDATGIDLGAVTIDGDLGRIRAGDATTTTSGLKGLTVQSMGRFGTSTGAPDLTTAVQGKLDFLKVKSDVKEAQINVVGGVDGKIGSVFIGGSLIGGTGGFSGRIFSSGDMGFVTIVGDLTGAGGSNSGEVISDAKLAGVKIGGSVQGGAGTRSGRIVSTGDMGFVTIVGDLVGGSASGGANLSESGSIRAKRIASLTLGGLTRVGQARAKNSGGSRNSATMPRFLDVGEPTRPADDDPEGAATDANSDPRLNFPLPRPETYPCKSPTPHPQMKIPRLRHHFALAILRFGRQNTLWIDDLHPPPNPPACRLPAARLPAPTRLDRTIT